MCMSIFRRHHPTGREFGDDSKEMKTNQIQNEGDFLVGPVVKIPPSNAGDTGSIPGQGTKIPHAARQLSPWATTTEPMHCN